MAESEFKISVSAELNPSSLQTLKSQISNLSTKDTTIKLNLDQKIFSDLSKVKTQLEEISKMKKNFFGIDKNIIATGINELIDWDDMSNNMKIKKN